MRAEQQLTLLCAGTAVRRRGQCERVARLASDVDWARLTETLRARKLLPTLGPRIAELADGHASGDFRAAVDQAIEAGRRQGAFLQLISLRALAVLAEVGIRASALKGPLLGEALYGDPGRRLSGDIDLLVAPEQLPTAVDVIRELGYEAPTDYVDDSGLPLLHFALLHERGELPPIELHWRVHWYEQGFARDRLLPPAVDPAGTWRPAPVDELAALLLFYARDGFIDLRLATDVGAWWDACGAELPADALPALMREYPELERVIRAAVKAAENTVGLPAARTIGDEPELGLRERVAVRLANPNPRSSRSQLYADVGLVDGLLTPSGGFRAFVQRQVLPPAEVLGQQAEHGERRRARSSLGRCAGILGRYSFRIAGLLRPSEARR
jgi:Uncharacterised nucleotidyltransferase